MSFPLTENFDGVTAPALPADATASAGSWATTTTVFSSSPNSVTSSTHNAVATLDFGADTNAGDVIVSAKIRHATISGAFQQTGIYARSSDALAQTSDYSSTLCSGTSDTVKGIVLNKQGTGTLGSVAFTMTTTDWYTVTLTIHGSGPVSLSVQVQRSSDSQYLTSAGGWQAGATDAITYSDSTSPITGAGHAGIIVYNDTTAPYVDDFSFQAYSTAATSYTLTDASPASGYVNNASGNFTVQANGTPSPALVVTPSDGGGGGTFTPTSLTISDASVHTFTYTPASAGTKTISVTHTGGGFTGDPGSVTYTANAQTLSVSPLYINTSGTTTVTFTGGGTLWTTSAPTFTPTGVAGVSVGTVTVVSDTSATAPVTTGSSTGAVTFTDSTTSATATATVEALVTYATRCIFPSVPGQTPQYTVYLAGSQQSGTAFQARTSTGVLQLGSTPCYEADFLGPTNTDLTAVWDDGSGATTNNAVDVPTLPQGTASGGSSPTAAQIATAVWEDLTTGGDFGTANSIGLLLKTNVNAPVGSIPTNPLTTLGANAPAGWLDIDAFSIDAWQVQTRRIDVTGTTTPATADTYISYGYHNNRTYFKSTTLGTPIYLWYDSVGTQWVLSEAVGVNGSGYFLSTGTTFFDGNFIAQGTATGTPNAAAHGGSMLSAQQYPTTFEGLTINGAATFSGGVVVSPTTLNTPAVQLTGNGAGPGLKITGGNIVAPAIMLITQSGTNADTILLSPDGTGKDINSKFFNGITSLSQWLGLMAGKQTGDATALTEIKATGAGSGTYDPTADSLQAVRDRGDAAWTTAASVTVTGGTVTSVTNTVNATIVSTGLDAIATTAPTTGKTPATMNFREILVMLARRFIAKATMPDTIGGSGSNLTMYADDGTTVLATQPVADSGTSQSQDKVTVS